MKMTRAHRCFALAISLAALSPGCGDNLRPASPDAVPEDDAPVSSLDAPVPPDDAPGDAPGSTDPNVVQTTAGPVMGRSTASMRTFQGIPYAAPPVGPLRWKPPVDPAPFTAVRDATAVAPHCAQPASRSARYRPARTACT